MFNYLKTKFLASLANKNNNSDSCDSQDENDLIKTPIKADIKSNMQSLEAKFATSSDYLKREIVIDNTGVAVNFLMIEGMINVQTMSEILIEPLLNQKFSKKDNAVSIDEFIQNRSVLAVDMKNIYSYEEIFQFIMSGFVVILIDGLAKAIVFGMQGFPFRSISEPSSEINERGSREGFTEPLRINMTMVRRRIKTPNLIFEILTIGKDSKTDACLMYMQNKVSPDLIKKIKAQIKKIKLDVILTSGYLQPFFEGEPKSLFSNVGVTERPDVVIGKINEGRVVIVVDGTPYALIIPYFFTENFQSLDDYSRKPYYVSFIRILKYIAFFIAILLPGVYVAIVSFHPEILPLSLLFNIVASEEITPFPIFIEALVFQFMYEIMREAGLRLPRPIGHAVSIVGALVIGDAAVNAGLVGSPTVLIVALTAISSFVVPSLYEPVALLRFGFIVVGGVFGFYGIALLSLVTLFNICSLSSFGTPYTAPISPFSKSAMRDTFYRIGFKKMQKRTAKIQDLDGVKIDED